MVARPCKTERFDRNFFVVGKYVGLAETIKKFNLIIFFKSLYQATAYESSARFSIDARSKPRTPPTAWKLRVSCSI